MKTPPDAFEHDLERLALRELPPHWRQEILAKAQKPRFAPSKPFLALLAAAWTAIITLQLLTPTPEAASQTQITPVFTPNSLFALHQHPDLLTP